MKSQSAQTMRFKALVHTARHRGTEYVLDGIAERFNTIRTSGEIAEQWRKYQSDHAFAASISVELVLDGIANLLNLMGYIIVPIEK